MTIDIKIDNLKPCPLCGQNVIVTKEHDEYWISCECGLSFEPEIGVDELVRQWNTRT